MSAARLLHSLHHIGAVVTVEGGDLLIDTTADLPDALLADLRAHKPELVALIQREPVNDPDEPPSPESVREWFRERLAIICEASELEADEAHALAVDRTLRHFW